MAGSLSVPTNLQLVRVFLASPSDLAEERRCARDAVEEINKTVARPNGFHVDLIGWEDTISERRRPQEAINEDLETCELFVGMMWKKWGTPPDLSGKHSSGFEEEFSLATSNYDSTGTPKIRLYFKEIDSSLLNDPGDDLKKVLKFRENIEEQKNTLYETFREPSDFASRFRVSVADYINRLRLEKERDKQSSSAGSRFPTGDGVDQDSGEQQIARGPAIIHSRFLHALASEVADVTSGVSQIEVARLRNLANALAGSQNDELMLQAHDANIIYAHRGELELSSPEITSLADAGLAAYKTDNLPVWHWVSDRTAEIPQWLALSTSVGPSEAQIGAFRALATLGRDVPGTILGGPRENFVGNWFREEVPNDLRVEALRFLGAIGRESDLALVDQELDRRNASTLTAALEAHVSIVLRFMSAREAAEFALGQSFDGIDDDLLTPVLNAMHELDDNLLRRALGHRCPKVRMQALCILEERQVLAVDETRSLLADATLSVREKALSALEVLEDRTWSKEDARPILIRKPTSGVFGVNPSAYDWEGEAALERRQIRELTGLPRTQLQAMVDAAEANWFLAYQALARRYFPSFALTVRRDFDDRFQARFRRYLDTTRAIAPGNSAVEELVERIAGGETFTRESWLRTAADVLVARGEKADLARIRKALDDDALRPSKSDIPYFGRTGEWEDIKRIQKISSDYRSGGISGSVLSYKSPISESAEAIVLLAKSRLDDLISADLGGELLAAVLFRVNKRNFSKLSDERIIRLLTDREDVVRKIAALRVVQVLTSSRIRKLAHEYTNLEYRFYNVVRWLDLGLSFDSTTGRAAASRELTKLSARWS